MANSLEGPMIIGVAAWIAYLVSAAGSRFAAQLQTLRDHPNHRSSHTRPTPKTGGLAIVGAWLAGMFVLAVFLSDNDITTYAAFLSGLAVCALGLGLADDLMNASPYLKFAGQFAVAALFAALFAPLAAAPIPFAGYVELAPVVGFVLTVLWIVAFMNAYNFMDGANGLASGSAAAAMCGFCVIAAFSGEAFAAASAFLLAAALFGFLPVNMKRGRLFMGDNGSQAVGFVIAALTVLAANLSDGRVSALVLPVIFLPFLMDVAATLVHRAVRGRNVLSAHREHVYQLMMRLGASHTQVAVTYMGLTSISVAAAILMLALPAGWQWLAPAGLAAVFAYPASRVYRAAAREGLLSVAEEAATPGPADDEEQPRQAAE